MVFGPNGEEKRKYESTAYYAAINHAVYRHDGNNGFESAASSEVTDMISGILHGEIESAIIKFNPYELMTIIRDLAITKNAWFVLKFGEMDKDKIDETIGGMLRASAICTNDNKNMLKILNQIKESHNNKMTQEFLSFYNVSLNAVITLGCTMAMGKDCVALWRSEIKKKTVATKVKKS